MAKSNLPKVTIGLPTFNRRTYLSAALDSARNQTYPNLEIIVSDNASEDGSWSYLEGIEDNRVVRLRQETNIGGIQNINACLAAATGELFLVLSDDDLLRANAIEELAKPFASPDGTLRENVGLTWSICDIIDSGGARKWATAAGPATESPASLLTSLFYGERGPRFSSVMVRTADAREVGGYNLERYNAMCDTANWGAVCLRYKETVCIAQPLVSYRVHAASHTGVSVAADWQCWGERMHDDLLAVLKRHGSPAEVARFVQARKSLLANLTVDVLMRSKGNPGWLVRALREVWRSRRFMFTFYVARRGVRDGWKLLKGQAT